MKASLLLCLVFLCVSGLMGQGLQGTYISTLDRYYEGFQLTSSKSRVDSISAWRGERIAFQVLIWTDSPVPEIQFSTSDLVGDKGTIPSSVVKLRFPSFVRGDPEARSCAEYNSRSGVHNIADMLSNEAPASLNAGDTIAVWVSIDIPFDLEPGQYTGILKVTSAASSQNYTMYVQVQDESLPHRADWKFHLDLWQFPNAVLEHYNNANGHAHIELWSEEHFDLIRPAYRLLADAGQQAITAHIKNRALGTPSMIIWKLTTANTWEYDYSAFDRYVAELMALGIDKQINCFSPVGWNESVIPYWDQASQSLKNLDAPLGSQSYRDRWDHFLTDFKKHLESKGWFDLVVLYLDEVAENKLEQVIETIQNNDPSWKLGIAYSHGLSDETKSHFFDLSGIIEDASNSGITEDKISTFYTSCTQTFPNSYVTKQNSPAEMMWMPYYSAANDFDGYLRWAFDYWRNSDPTDIRDGSNTAGDFAIIYRSSNERPIEYYSSLRLEMLRDGIEDYEKIQVLKDRYNTANRFDQDVLMELEKMLEIFDIPSGTSARESVLKAQEKLTAIASEEIPFCRAEGMDPSNYFFSEIKTQGGDVDITYASSEYPLDGYERPAGETLAVRPGAQIDFHFKSDLSTCFQVAGWIDWDLNLEFDAAAELVFQANNSIDCSEGSVTANVTIPEDTPFGRSRVRFQIVESNAEIASCGIAKNASFVDFDFEIRDAYCSVGSGSVNDTGLESLILTTCESTVVLDTPEVTAGYYFDREQLFTVGLDNVFSIQLEQNAEIFCDQTLIWIDWNQDEEFSVETELVHESINSDFELNTGGQIWVQVPKDAALGKSRIRIQNIVGENVPMDPCTDNSDVITYDLNLGIIDTQTCRPNIVSPPPGSRLVNKSQQFEWSSNGMAVDVWTLTIREIDVEENANVFFEGTFEAGELMASVDDLPDNGNRVVVTLGYQAKGETESVDYNYSAPDKYCSTRSGNHFDEYYFSQISTSGGSKDISFANNNSAKGYVRHQSSVLIVDLEQVFQLSFELSPKSSCARLLGWIDWDMDGDFEDTEMISNEGLTQSCNNPTSGIIPIAVPQLSGTGLTRMRLKLRDAWLSTPDPCVNETFSSTVDFDVILNQGIATLVDDPFTNISIFPNPTHSIVEIRGLSGNHIGVKIISSEGVVLDTLEFENLSNSSIEIDGAGLDRGVYLFDISVDRKAHEVYRLLIQ